MIIINKLFVLVGPSAAGKTVISNFLMGNKIKDEEIGKITKDYNEEMANEIKSNIRKIEENQCTKLSKITTSTTRQPRKGEVNGVDYYFYDNDTFNAMVKNNEFLEHINIFGNQYGSTYKSIEESLKYNNSIIVLDDDGCSKMKNIFKDRIVSIFLDVSIEVMEKRMNFRLDDVEAIKERIENLKILEYKDKCDYVINTEKRFDYIIDEILKIVNYEVNN